MLSLQRDHPLIRLFDLEKETRLSQLFDLSGVQESLPFRALSRARLLSLALIDGKGEIDRNLLKKTRSLLEKEGILFCPGGYNDGQIHAHFLTVLKALDSDAAALSLKKFQGPLCHKWAESLIFQTLGIPAAGSPTDAQIRAAVVCACLTPLRQNVGSCFATAPAILIQRSQLPLFLDDLYQLLSTGKLKRTFGGIEYALPLSPSTGIADLKKNLLSRSDKFRPGFCPGLIAALETAEQIDPSLSLEEKGKAAESLIEQLASGKKKFTSEECIHAVLLAKFSLTDEEIAKLKISPFKKTRLSLFPAPSTKEIEILNFKEKEKACRAAFKAISDNALLRAWEFTLASFSEVKMEFSRWNLYSSLGFSSHEPGGIGELLYQKIDAKIAEINKKLEVRQQEYEIAFDQVRATEALLRGASSESEVRRLRAEHQSRTYHMRACLEARDDLYAKGSHYSNLFPLLLQEYDKKFPDYFQEIYDAEMLEVEGDLYDDSPAGFRLVYKHGRQDPSLWTLIYDADHYTDALVDFFTMTENTIAADQPEGLREFIAELTGAVIAHAQTKEFLDSALKRMARAHQVAAGSSDKKPWAYTSGGTMTTLLKTYYCREGELTQEEKWVESESELLIFFLDTLKNLPHKITDPFLKGPQEGMLASSPTHAFLLLPGIEQFRKGWNEEIFTYTWVRDEIFLPSQQFYASMRLHEEEQGVLLTAFAEEISLPYGLHAKHTPCTVQEFRKHLLETFGGANKQKLADLIDSFLYQNLPLVRGKEWKALVRRILSDKAPDKLETVLKQMADAPASFLTARQIREMAKGCYLLAERKLTLGFDLHSFTASHARFVGVAQPSPVLVADTNWAGYYFSFLVNPGSGRLELWRTDSTLSQGMPMSEWKHFVNGTDRKSWSLFTRPYEYKNLSQ